MILQPLRSTYVPLRHYERLDLDSGRQKIALRVSQINSNHQTSHPSIIALVATSELEIGKSQHRGLAIVQEIGYVKGSSVMAVVDLWRESIVDVPLSFRPTW